MDEAEVRKTLEKSHIFNILYFEEMVQDEYMAHGEPMEEEIERSEMIKILGGFITELPERERLVITLYYYEEMTLKEISRVLGVTESRVFQIHSKAVMLLRAKMDTVYAF